MYEVIGFAYRDNFIRKQGKLNLSKKQVWEKLVEFIQDEVKVNEKINLVEESSQFEESKDNNPIFDEHKKSHNTKNNLEKGSSECVLRGKTDHVVTIDHFGRQVVQYYSSKPFTDMTPRERVKLLVDIKACVITVCLWVHHQTAVSIGLSRVLASLYVDMKRIRDIPRKKCIVM